jgi:hypothetical protein
MSNTKSAAMKSNKNEETQFLNGNSLKLMPRHSLADSSAAASLSFTFL